MLVSACPHPDATNCLAHVVIAVISLLGIGENANLALRGELS
jgi:hypothetical protein